MQEQVLVSEYEVGARRIAEAIIARASAPGASGDDRTKAETALTILGNAGKRARLVDGPAHEAMSAAIRDLDEQAEARITGMALGGASADEIQEAVDRSVAERGALERQMKAMVDRQATSAWQEAFDHLARLIDAGEPR